MSETNIHLGPFSPPRLLSFFKQAQKEELKVAKEQAAEGVKEQLLWEEVEKENSRLKTEMASLPVLQKENDRMKKELESVPALQKELETLRSTVTKFKLSSGTEEQVEVGGIEGQVLQKNKGEYRNRFCFHYSLRLLINNFCVFVQQRIRGLELTPQRPLLDSLQTAARPPPEPQTHTPGSSGMNRRKRKSLRGINMRRVRRNGLKREKSLRGRTENKKSLKKNGRKRNGEKDCLIKRKKRPVSRRGRVMK